MSKAKSPKVNAVVFWRLSSSPATSASLVVASAQGSDRMEPSYSVVADALSKFHTASEGIQALWLVTGAVTVLGTAFCGLQAVRAVAGLLALRGERRGEALYAVYEEADGRLMLYARGTVRELPRGEGGAVALPDPLQRR